MAKKKLKKFLKKAAPLALGLLGAAALGKRKKRADSMAANEAKEFGFGQMKLKDYGPFSKAAAPKTRSNASIAGDFISKVIDPRKMEYGMQMSNDLVDSQLPGRVRAPTPSYDNSIIQQYKKGGRVGCGVAKKGFGRAMKKGGKK